MPMASLLLDSLLAPLVLQNSSVNDSGMGVQCRLSIYTIAGSNTVICTSYLYCIEKQKGANVK